MDSANLIELTKKTIEEANYYKTNSQYTINKLKKTLRVLHCLLSDLEKNNDINRRVLRGMCDVGMYSYKCFENSRLELAINKLNNMIWDEIEEFRGLVPLGNDFGKEYPI